jgi:hypothetical protein
MRIEIGSTVDVETGCNYYQRRARVWSVLHGVDVNIDVNRSRMLLRQQLLLPEGSVTNAFATSGSTSNSSESELSDCRIVIVVHLNWSS